MPTTLGRLIYWADDSSPWAEELRRALVSRFDELVDTDPGVNGVTARPGDTVLLVLSGPDSEKALGWMERLAPDDHVDVIVVADDSYLGTDVALARATVSGAAVALTRSLAVRRGTTVRANAICVAPVEDASELRGPLPVEVTVDDLVEAIVFLAGPDGSYVSGQVLYVNGGRHLFSSHTS